MPRRGGGSSMRTSSSSSRGGGFGGLFGKRSTTPTATRRPAAPPSRPAAAAPPATTGGGGMLSGIGGAIAQGMAFGGGSAIAHRAVDAIAGPRETRVVHDHGDGAAAPAAGAAGAAAAAAPAAAAPDCSSYMSNMNKCFSENSSDISFCQPQVDMFKSCTSGELLQ